MPKSSKVEEIIPQLIVKRISIKFIIIAIILVLLALVPSIYFYSKYSQSQKLLQNQTNDQTAALVEKVSKLIELPKNEVPTIATVADKTKLTDQVFFANAQNGDKVLIYTQAKKAILYRPSTNKIIEVAPVNLGDQAKTNPVTSPAASPSAAPKIVKVALYNGTTTIGLTATAEKQLKLKLPDVKVTVKESADKDDYLKTLVSDQTGKQGQTAKQIAEIIGGELSSISATKSLPSYKDADILVILGEDYTK